MTTAAIFIVALALVLAGVIVLRGLQAVAQSIDDAGTTARNGLDHVALVLGRKVDALHVIAQVLPSIVSVCNRQADAAQRMADTQAQTQAQARELLGHLVGCAQRAGLIPDELDDGPAIDISRISVRVGDVEVLNMSGAELSSWADLMGLRHAAG